ncbi:hypothetical protein [Paractinoplanes maris]|uniref:hypothetical protein n=1 Tax=Paractinoplanes maris TaxID=1734446 RepID=UPI00202097D6|nr:hypothetical protein [Actinoplanes maris]
MSESRPPSEPLIDLSVIRPSAPRHPHARLRRQAAVVAVVAALTGAGGYTALRPALAATTPDAVPAPPAAATPAPPAPVRWGTPTAAADPVHAR